MNNKTVPQPNAAIAESTLLKELSAAGELTPIGVSEARRVMGSSGDSMTDAEVQDVVYHLTAIARSFMKSVPKYETFNIM